MFQVFPLRENMFCEHSVCSVITSSIPSLILSKCFRNLLEIPGYIQTPGRTRGKKLCSMYRNLLVDISQFHFNGMVRKLEYARNS